MHHELTDKKLNESTVNRFKYKLLDRKIHTAREKLGSLKRNREEMLSRKDMTKEQKAEANKKLKDRRKKSRMNDKLKSTAGNQMK